MTETLKPLYEKLEAEGGWPKVYLFKFIVASDHRKLAQLSQLFGPAAQITIRQSSGGKFTSVSARELMLNPDEVVSRYENASAIEGLLSL